MKISASPAFSVKIGRPVPSVAEYTAFRGMLCGMKASQRCIDSFDGCALFASEQEYERCGMDLAALDFTRTPVPLNLFSYYLLVLVSFTGLSTLLGATKTLLVRDESTTFSSDAREASDEKDDDSKVFVAAKTHSDLVIPKSVFKYIQKRSQWLEGTDSTTSVTADSTATSLPDVQLTRRFEFQFANYLSVMMCHFVCSHGRKYLVEVYRVKPGILKRISQVIVFLTRAILRILGFFPKKKTN